MSTTEAELSLLLLGKEILTPAEAPAAETQSQRTMRTGGKGINKAQLNSTSTPKLDKPIIAFELTLTNGAPTTIDLTAVQGLVMPTGLTRTIDLSGAKLKAWLFETPAANVGTVTIAPGAANPYPLYGASKDLILPKSFVLASGFKAAESSLAAVAGGAKTLTFSTSNTGDKLYVELWAGT